MFLLKKKKIQQSYVLVCWSIFLLQIPGCSSFKVHNLKIIEVNFFSIFIYNLLWRIFNSLAQL